MHPALAAWPGCTSGLDPGTAPRPAPTPLLLDQSQAGWPPPATWASFHHSLGLHQPAAASSRSSSPPAQWEGTLARLRTLGKEELDPAPSCCFAPPLCVQGTSGAVPQELPLVTGEAGGGGGGGTRREDGECGAWVPPELVGHPPPFPRPKAGHCA